MTEERQRVLLEEMLPFRELGVETQRERSVSSALPPLFYLHVWWARRPLTMSRAAVLASLLPSETDQEWFLKLLGIHGAPVEAQEEIRKANEEGRRLDDPYGYRRAFQYNPDNEQLQQLKTRVAEFWGTDNLQVLDPMAGGGSIPLEMYRFGLETYTNELNPVAFIILKATIEYPGRFGLGLIRDIRHWAKKVHQKAQEKLEEFYPKCTDEDIFAYLWAHTIECPSCGLTLPLSPNWWLDKKSARRGIAVLPEVDHEENRCTFEIVEVTEDSTFDPQEGTISYGKAACWCREETIDGDEIKRQAQNGQMSRQLYAVGYRQDGKKRFRLPTEKELEALERARKQLGRRWTQWEQKSFIPTEEYPANNSDLRPRHYGMTRWCDLFSPRQLLGHLVHLEAIYEMRDELFEELKAERAEAVITYIAFMLDKCVDYNSRMAVWDSTRTGVRHTFVGHDFRFVWSHGEWDYARQLWPWAIDQVVDAYEDLCELIGGTAGPLVKKDNENSLTITCSSATRLTDFDDEQLALVCVDPPYYDNVMYSELSDFFYVWQKRVLGDIFPEAFSEELTPKDEEAVSNPARFREFEGSNKKMAERDYELKMQACFSEIHRCLRRDGVLTLMFTHKRVEAWDTLAAALIEAGFEITATWPVRSESRYSLGIARSNAAESTILLCCRKRVVSNRESEQTTWWEDIRQQVRHVARDKAEEFESHGIHGVDLQLATFGPVLNVLSGSWPVLTREGERLRPDRVLDEARQAVLQYRFERLVGATADVNLDPLTEWYILTWDEFLTPKFRYDEARKLALSVGIEDFDGRVSKQKRMTWKSGRFVEHRTPKERLERGQFTLDDEQFDTIIDAVQAATLTFERGGADAVQRLYNRSGLGDDRQFNAALQALLRAIPATRDEYKLLREMVLATQPEAEWVQTTLLGDEDR